MIIISRRVIFLFFCFQVSSHAIFMERGKHQKNIVHSIMALKNNVTPSETNTIKYEEDDSKENENYDIGFQRLTKKQIIRRKEILKERRAKMLKFLEKLRKRQKIIKNKLHK